MTPGGASRWMTVAALAAATAPAEAQSLASRVESMSAGVVRVTYAIREGVQVCERGIKMDDGDQAWWRGSRRGGEACRTGTVEAELAIRDGAVRDLELLDPGDLPTPGSVDLGTVDSGEAARFFLTLARGSTGQPALEDAVAAAALADAPDLWPDLMAIARDRELDSDVRSDALFWLGQDAAAAASAGIAAVASDEREEQEVREAAVFALSQRPADEGIPLLMEIARAAQEAETRENAMFWLAQHDDARVLAFFEEILLARAPR